MSRTNGTGPTPPLGERLRALREKRDLTMEQLADRLAKIGVHATKGGIGHTERGLHPPRPELLLGIAHILKARDRDFPELYVARARVALDDDDVKGAVDQLRKLLRAQRVSEPDGPSTVAEGAQLFPEPAGESRKQRGQADARRAARRQDKSA